MGIEVWVVLAVAAALAQTSRNALAQSLSSTISPALNSWARFTFCLPFATALVGVLAARHGSPQLSGTFFSFCLITALSQLLGNVALIAAFRAGSFGESIVFHKLEVILTAVAGVLFFHEVPSLLGGVGIVICGLGVLVMNLARDSADRRWRRAFALGRSGTLALLCAALLVIASFALKTASAELVRLNPSLGAAGIGGPAQTLFHTTWIEVVFLTAWIRWKEPQSFRFVGLHWRRMALIGTFGFAASLGWFWAFSLTLVAYVKAVGQIEALIAVALGIRLLQERALLRQLPGVALVSIGIALVLLS